jgi:hypothetical protein
MSALEGASRESKLIFLWIFTAVAALFTIATTFFLVGDLRGRRGHRHGGPCLLAAGVQHLVRHEGRTALPGSRPQMGAAYGHRQRVGHLPGALLGHLPLQQRPAGGRPIPRPTSVLNHSPVESPTTAFSRSGDVWQAGAYGLEDHDGQLRYGVRYGGAANLPARCHVVDRHRAA